MSILFFDGFESVVQLRKPEWSNDWGNWSDTGRWTGGYSVRAAVDNTLTLPSSAATCLLGVGVMPRSNGYGNVLGSTAGCLVAWQVGGVTQCCLTVSAAGYLQFRLGGPGGTVLATATTGALSANTWGYLQAKVLCHATAGTLEAKVNGVTVLSYTGQTATTAGAVNKLFLDAYTGGGDNFAVSYDDLWVCDAVDATSTQGRANNDYLGDMKVVALVPTAAGAQTEWTPSTGANWAAVDEVPPNTSDYVSTSTIGAKDLYDITDLAATVTGVYGVRVGLYAEKSDAGSASVKPVTKESGIAAVSGAAQPLTAAWASYWGDQRFVKDGGAVYSVSDLNALQIGVEAAA